MRRLPLLPSLFALALWAFCGHAAAAPPTLGGTWVASALRSDWNIGEWGAPCGPKPTGGGAAAGNVTITTNGSELALAGAGRNYSTTECWEQFPGLQRTSHSASGRAWRNTCKTQATDPRQATIVTTISATDSRISFDETGQYQFVINGQNCTASARRTRTYQLLHRDGDPLPSLAATTASSATSAAAPPPTPTSRTCDSPGPPVRLEVRPSRKLIRPGESFQFQTLVQDASGCTLRLSPSWKLVTEHATVELVGSGKIQVPNDAPEATVELQASLSGHAVLVEIDIASQERYDALLAQNGMNADGESNDAAVARIATTTVGGGSAVARDDSQRRRVLFVAVMGGLAFVLGLLGFALVQRNRRKLVATLPRARDGAEGGAHLLTPNRLPTLAKICPTCRDEYPPEATFCPNDGNRLVVSRGNMEPAGPSGGVCPVCGQGYDPGVSSCPKHGEELIPAAVFAGTGEPETAVIKKICPVCGRRYEGESQFCGGCGAALVPMN